MALAKPLTDTLLDLAEHSGCVDHQTCATELNQAAEQQRSLVGATLDTGLVDETRFLSGLSETVGLQWWDEPVASVPVTLREKFPARIALRHHLLPVQEEDDDQLWVLTYDPFNFVARQVVAQSLDETVRWAMAPRKKILDALRQGYGVGAETFEELLLDRTDEEIEDELKQETTVLDAEDSEASVVKFVNQIIREALEEHATDIHVEPLENDLRIRYRIDGVLHEVPVPPNIRVLQASVISRLKIMAHLDIAEKRLPQDGRINLELEGRPIDVRVATIPSVAGETISLRLLGQERYDFSRLGLEKVDERNIRSLLDMPNGIILVTGPTGCGKSTTLYTFLASLNTKERRIVTIEDPVEQKLEGVIQIAVKPDINLSFAEGLRSILRGDPNVVMVGEMRDFETAEIAIRAALTGHLVFSTLHTNDAVGGITRLIDMGVEPFLVASSVRAFIAQRLVRVLCSECRRPARKPEDYLLKVGFPMEHADKIYEAVGCEQCRMTGYRGRRAIFEICLSSPRLEEMITAKEPGSVLRPIAISEGMVPLRQDGWRKVIDGITTVEEVIRVTTADVEMQDE